MFADFRRHSPKLFLAVRIFLTPNIGGPARPRYAAKLGSGQSFTTRTQVPNHPGGSKSTEVALNYHARQNWALEELHQLRQAERVRRHRAYEQFKARRAPEELRNKWREAKAAQRAAVRAARVEAAERKRRDEELAAKEAALAAEAERERKSWEPIAGSGSEIELQILQIPPNPRMVVRQYWAEGEERRCVVRAGRNANFRTGMKLLVKRPAVGADIEPWKYDGSLPRRPGH